mmetsp:Transcript_6670/g.19778  ORF Transcript_6670/g.19778 Transcript_6670/m.19778 type:complete len:96 (+) Transcript_6670:1-288(+)
MADTNIAQPMTLFGKQSQSVVQDILPRARASASTELVSTCCAWKYRFTYDRIITVGFPEGSAMETVLPFGDSPPPWVALNMHNPIVGRFSITSGG